MNVDDNTDYDIDRNNHRNEMWLEFWSTDLQSIIYDDKSPLKTLKVELAGTKSGGGEYQNYGCSDAAAFFWIQIPQFVKAAKRTFDSKLMGTDIRRLGLLGDVNDEP